MEEKLNTSTPNRRETVRTIYRSVVSLVLSFFVVIFAVGVGLRSFGWFSSNKDVKGTGMSVSIKGSPSLIISDDINDVLHPVNINALFRKSFTRATTLDLEPATHDAEHNLVVVVADDEMNIDPDSGLTKNDSSIQDFTFTTAVPGVNYYDFVTYIGVFGVSLEYCELTLSLDPQNCFAQCVEDETAVAEKTYYLRSGSSFTEVTLPVGSVATGYYTNVFDGVYLTVGIDVLIDDVYKTTLLPSGNTESTGVSVQLTDGPGVMVPGSVMKVTLRVFFDGAMRDPSTTQIKTILRANNQTVNQIFLKVDYVAQ